MNEFRITGRLGNDPKDMGKAVFLSLATPIRFTRDNERVERTAWNDVVVFDRLADVVRRYIRKGDFILVTGEVSKGSYEKNGQTYYTVDLVGRKIEFLDVKGDNRQPSVRSGANAGQQNSGSPPPLSSDGKKKRQ